MSHWPGTLDRHCSKYDGGLSRSTYCTECPDSLTCYVFLSLLVIHTSIPVLFEGCQSWIHICHHAVIHHKLSWLIRSDSFHPSDWRHPVHHTPVGQQESLLEILRNSSLAEQKRWKNVLSTGPLKHWKWTGSNVYSTNTLMVKTWGTTTQFVKVTPFIDVY